MKLMNIVHEEFTVERDGLTMHGSMFRPKGAGPFPTIVVSHEFMMNRLTTLPHAFMFARLGFAAFCYDFNGGGSISQSDGKTTDMSVLTETKDLKAVIDYVSKQPYTDMDRFQLMGCSQGGFVSALVAAELGADKVKRLILYYPALSIPDDARKGSMLMAKFDPKNVPDKLFCGPIILGKTYPETVMDWDPFPMISKYHGPVLLVGGDKDHVVDYSYFVKAYDAYVAGNKEALAKGEISELPQVELETIRGGEHMFPVPMHYIDARNTAKMFALGRTEVLRVDVRLVDKMTFKLKGGKLDWNIPFTGVGTGRFYEGKVRPGASDQRYYGIGTADVCADYTFEGKDYTGEPAEIHVVNRNHPTETWKPTVTTTSKALDFLNHNEAYARLRQLKWPLGPLVRIFVDYEATK